MDPLLQMTLVLSLSGLFGVTGVQKLCAFREWPDVLRNYQMLPDPWVRLVAAILPGAELAIAAALMLAPLRAMAALAAAGLLLLFALAIGVNLKRGRREIDCGCLGGRLKQPLAPWMLVRNAVLAAAALALRVPLSPRPLAPLELLVAAGAALTLAVLYCALGLVLAAPASQGARAADALGPPS
jgi:hypothetical protein